MQDVLAQSAAQSVVATHHQLAAAAAQAQQLAATDPLLPRLQAAIDGCTPAPQVIDVQATELPRSRPTSGDFTDVDTATATGTGTAAVARPAPSDA